MPVTARLSKRLYDSFGEDVAQELVDWFNQVDATYRGDLREFNELNFSRFDAKLAQRTVEIVSLIDGRFSALDGRLTRLETRVGHLETRMDRLETRMDRLETGMDGLETRMAGLEGRVAGLEMSIGDLQTKVDRMDVELRAAVQDVETRMTAGFDTIEQRLGHQLAGVRAELIKWMFVIVVGTGLAAVAAISQLVV